MNQVKAVDYPYTIRALSHEDGGGYLIEFPDLPGCMSDGDIIDEAVVNGQKAVKSWIETASNMPCLIRKFKWCKLV